MKSWSDLLQQTLTDSADRVPKGWQTTKEVAEDMGLSNPRASALLRQWVKTGRAEMKQFRIKTGQRVYPVPHYKVK